MKTFEAIEKLISDSYDNELFSGADKVYIRGLIEFTNYCKNNCYYCGIRRDNKKAVRYRPTKEEILAYCEKIVMKGDIIESSRKCIDEMLRLGK